VEASLCEGGGSWGNHGFPHVENATSAYMTGKLKVKGDMGAAMKLQKLF
jgi:hypothetical protein